MLNMTVDNLFDGAINKQINKIFPLLCMLKVIIVEIARHKQKPNDKLRVEKGNTFDSVKINDSLRSTVNEHID